jgi:UDP-glucose 4-epimerase
MHILVTGALGFVGLNLVRWLASQPDVAVIAADLRAPSAATLAALAPVQARVRVLSLDVTDRAAFYATLAETQPTHIIHAAALTPTAEAERTNPTPIVEVNLHSVTYMLEAARQVASVQGVLVVSSSGVYGAPPPNAPPTQRATQDEAGPLQLDNLYAITKRSGEQLAARYGELGGPRVAAVRLSAIYGPGEEPSPTRPQISQVGALLRALRAEKSVRVAGPQIVRDWTHTDDVAAALLALLRAERWRHGVYNVSNGTGLSFQRVVDAFVQHGLRAEWRDDPAAADIAMTEAMARLPLDITRLQQDTGFRPQVSFAEGVARLVAAL